MDSVPIIAALAGIATMMVLATATYTLWIRRAGRAVDQRTGTIWKRAFHLGAELAAGRAIDRNSDNLIELIDSVSDPILVATAIAVAARQEPEQVHPALYSTISRSRLPSILNDHLATAETNVQIEALEIVEVLHVYELLGEAAALTRNCEPRVVRAACDAVVEIDPSIGAGILIGMTDDEESWVLDSLGRAASALETDENRSIPLSRSQWGNAPMLAQRALLESHAFDRATLSTALASLIGALESDLPAKRLAAVTALSVSIENPAAQLALAGALGAKDRMTRFATAANLMDTVTGREIVKMAAAQDDGSDATRMAAEILWSDGDRGKTKLDLVAS